MDPRPRLSFDTSPIGPDGTLTPCTAGELPPLRASVRHDQVFIDPIAALPDGVQACSTPTVVVQAFESQCMESTSVDSSFGSSISIVPGASSSQNDGTITLAVAASSQVVLPRDESKNEPERPLDATAFSGVIHLIRVGPQTQSPEATGFAVTYHGPLRGLAKSMERLAVVTRDALNHSSLEPGRYVLGSIHSSRGPNGSVGIAAIAVPQFHVGIGPSYTLDHSPYGMPMLLNRELSTNGSTGSQLAPIVSTTGVHLPPTFESLHTAAIQHDRLDAQQDNNCSTSALAFNISVVLHPRRTNATSQATSHVGIVPGSFEVLRASVLGLECRQATVLQARVLGGVHQPSDSVALEV